MFVRVFLSGVLLLLCLSFCLTYKTYKCDTCKNFVKKFNRGLDTTSKSNFGGGNTNWEEKNLGSYAKSEARFLEILENACDKTDKNECHSMIEEYEEYLEIWWFKHYREADVKDLYTYFCDQTLKVCCPNGTFGPNCLDCPGGRLSFCSGHGKCKGEGQRKGKGTCSCDDGYEGDLCDDCSDGYFSGVGDDGTVTCTECHKACKTACTSALPSSCEDCKSGWMFGDQGCVDIDECKDVKCSDNQYCLNTEGSYKCEGCHEACSGCTGPTKHQCLACSAKHFLKDSECGACHPSCKDSCSDESPETCDGCTAGWMFLNEANGCVDKDECRDDNHDCDINQYCSNVPGTFKCLDCHKTCKGCTGGESNQCLACKHGFQFDDEGKCSDVNECTSETAACTGENEQCVNTLGSFRCDCVNGYVRRMGSACFKKTTDRKKKKSKATKEPKRPGPTEDGFDAKPGPNSQEDIEKQVDPLEPKEQTSTTTEESQQPSRDEL